MTSTPSQGRGRRSAWWNLLLLLPLLLLIPGLYDFDQPRLFGMPAFYWIQLAFVVVSVISAGVVVQKMPRNEPVRTDRPNALTVDDLDRREADKESE
jgi:hypothetical protein